MTDVFGPFAGAPWDEGNWADFAYVWAASGVVGVPATAATSGDLGFAASGLTVSAAAGKAWIAGAGFKRTGTPATHAVSANTHASFSRRDRLVLRRDLANHQVVTAVLQGTPASTPVAPDLTQTPAGVWEIPLHSFLVPPNSGTTITGVVDERPWVHPDTGQLQFRTTAARDAALPVPADGLSVWVGADNAFYDRIAGAWSQRTAGTAAATASTLVRRDSAGRFAAAAPSATADVATKGYADGLGTSANTANTIVRRDGNGRFTAVSPAGTNDVATKAYVDGQFKAGGGTYTTNASGYTTVTHGAGYTPAAVQVTGREESNAGLVYAVTTVSSTTFTLYVSNGVNAPQASLAVPIFWTVFA